MHHCLWQFLFPRCTLQTDRVTAFLPTFRSSDVSDDVMSASHITCITTHPLLYICMVYLGDNDRAARELFVQHPREQGEWCSQNPSVARDFGVIICPAPEGAGRTTPEETGHYSHYNTKLTKSRYFHGNSYRIALTEPPARPSCSW